MTSRFHLLIAAACVLALTAAALHAQEGETEEAPQRPISFATAVDAEYTDNRDSKPEKEATLDVYTRPRVDILLDGRSGVLDLYYQPAYRYRSNPAKGRRRSEFFHDGGIEGRLIASSRLVLGVMDEFRESDDPSYQQFDTSLRRDARYLLNRATATARCQMTRRTRLDLQGRHTYKRYTNRELWEIANEQSAVGSGSLWVRLVPNLSVAAMGSYESFDYPDEEGVERDFVSTLAGLGVRQRLTGTARALLTLGWKVLDFTDQEMGNAAGPYGRLSVTGAPFPALRVTSGVSHMLRDSDVYPYAAQQYSGADASIEYDLLEELTIALGGAYRVSQYDRSTLPRSFVQQAEEAAAVLEVDPAVEAETVPVEGGTERAIVANGQIMYRCGTGKTIRLYQRMEQLISELGDSFTRNATGLAFVAEF